MFDMPYGKAGIVVQEHKPAGVFKKAWYSVDYQCHGCWHNCGGGSPIRKREDIQKTFEETKQRILKCKDWKGKPKLEVIDFRKVQTKLLECTLIV